MQTLAVAERQILSELQTLEPARWSEVLDFIGYLKQKVDLTKKIRVHSKELTASDLLQSDLVGLWADREDIGDSVQFARKLREQAEHRWGHQDATH
jgi:hypothetical protein